MGVSELVQPWRHNYVHATVWEQEFPPLSLPDMFAASVAAHPSAPAVEFLGRNHSYADLLAQARGFAAGLQQRGIGKGDRVGLYLPNVPAYVPAYFGALMAGAVVVNFSALYTAEELEA